MLTPEKVINHENKLKEARRVIYKRARHREIYKTQVQKTKEWDKLEEMIKEIK